MDYILRTLEIRELLRVNCLRDKTYDDEFEDLRIHFEGCLYWTSSIYNINHLLSVVLEQLERRGADTSEVVKYVYNLINERQFSIQEGTEEYLDSLYRIPSNLDIELEDELISAQKRICEHEW